MNIEIMEILFDLIGTDEDVRESGVFYSKKKITEVALDPNLETADVDRSDNYWPQRIQPSRFDLFKANEGKALNDMQKAKK